MPPPSADTPSLRAVRLMRSYGDGAQRRIALDEGKRAMRVVHPSAVTVYDALQDGDDVWLVMEYVPSRNMADFLAEHGTLTPEQAGLPRARLEDYARVWAGVCCPVRPPHGRVVYGVCTPIHTSLPTWRGRQGGGRTGSR